MIGSEFISSLPCDYSHDEQVHNIEIMSFEDFQKMEDLEIKITNEVLSVYDENDQEITDSDEYHIKE